MTHESAEAENAAQTAPVPARMSVSCIGLTALSTESQQCRKGHSLPLVMSEALTLWEVDRAQRARQHERDGTVLKRLKAA